MPKRCSGICSKKGIIDLGYLKSLTDVKEVVLYHNNFGISSTLGQEPRSWLYQLVDQQIISGFYEIGISQAEIPTESALNAVKMLSVLTRPILNCWEKGRNSSDRFFSEKNSSGVTRPHTVKEIHVAMRFDIIKLFHQHNGFRYFEFVLKN